MKKEKLDKILEEIQEVENSEYESSTFDDRIQSSNIANASISDTPLKKSYRYEELPDEMVEEFSPDKLPLLYIDVKISHDKVSRLILYRNQTPYEAATDFIQEHNIPIKLRSYLI